MFQAVYRTEAAKGSVNNPFEIGDSINIRDDGLGLSKKMGVRVKEFLTLTPIFSVVRCLCHHPGSLVQNVG